MIATGLGECTVRHPGEPPAIKNHLTAGGFIQAADNIKQSGLAASRWSGKHHKTAPFNVKIDIAQGYNFHLCTRMKGLVNLLYFQKVVHVSTPC